MENPCCSCKLTPVSPAHALQIKVLLKLVTKLVQLVKGAPKINPVRGGAQHGLRPDTMALITSDCDAMRSPSINRP